MNVEATSEQPTTVERKTHPPLVSSVLLAGQPKPYYQDASVTIYHGDSREIMAKNKGRDE
jgi:hypothetical protein